MNRTIQIDQEVGRSPASQGQATGLRPQPATPSSQSGVLNAARRKRDPHGRFVKRLRDTPEDSQEWLIWSDYHRAWHRRSFIGGACGYADDIADAGLFERPKAVAYHGDGRNTAVHVTDAYAKIVAAIALHEEKLSGLADKTAALWRLRSVASGMSTGTAKTPQAAEGRSPASPAPKGDAQ